MKQKKRYLDFCTLSDTITRVSIISCSLSRTPFLVVVLDVSSSSSSSALFLETEDAWVVNCKI